VPGNVVNAAPTSVMPWGLCLAFSQTHEHVVKLVEYPCGDFQSGLVFSTSRKSWKISRKLEASEFETLREFYEDCQGPIVPFYFYAPWETSPKFSYDPLGMATTGRYTVRFDGAWQQHSEIRRAACEISIIEIA
jgi:hypothetical protein